MLSTSHSVLFLPLMESRSDIIPQLKVLVTNASMSPLVAILASTSTGHENDLLSLVPSYLWRLASPAYHILSTLPYVVCVFGIFGNSRSLPYGIPLPPRP